MERAAAMLDETGLELGVACGEVLSAALTDVAVALPESDPLAPLSRNLLSRSVHPSARAPATSRAPSANLRIDKIIIVCCPRLVPAVEGFH